MEDATFGYDKKKAIDFIAQKTTLPYREEQISYALGIRNYFLMVFLFGDPSQGEGNPYDWSFHALSQNDIAYLLEIITRGGVAINNSDLRKVLEAEYEYLVAHSIVQDDGVWSEESISDKNDLDSKVYLDKTESFDQFTKNQGFTFTPSSPKLEQQNNDPFAAQWKRILLFILMFLVITLITWVIRLLTPLP